MAEVLWKCYPLDEPVTSPSGAWALRYDADGRAVIGDGAGAVTWAAGEVGPLRLGPHGVFAVYGAEPDFEGAVIWRPNLPYFGYSSLRVTDFGDGVLFDGGVPVYSLLHGPIAPGAGVEGLGSADPGSAAAPDSVPADGNPFTDWLHYGIDSLGCAVTVIHNVQPDEALRRFGASDDLISTTTWTELAHRYFAGDVLATRVLAAFALGPHALVVEEGGYRGADVPGVSRGTFAVTSMYTINADQFFAVGRDGVTLVEFQEGDPGEAEGVEIDIADGPLAELGFGPAHADDRSTYDDDDYDEDSFLSELQGVELVCRVAEVRPTIATVAGAVRGAIIPDRSDW
ncbi:DUF6461 domain-containing protein [Nocardia sp. NPDC057353]|uniref:DUF6461 domain-containing protein n=1 Tax=Nocardia sp. NPDC057353 TaxID=3346104 RepID=UPI003629BC5D